MSSAPQEKLLNDLRFKIAKKENGSVFSLDTDFMISRISWVGVVTETTAKTLLTCGADSVEHHGYKKLLLDRRDLVEFSTEARVWIKQDLLKKRARRIVGKVEKVATIGATNAKGNIFSNFISSGIRMIFPKLEMKKFDNLPEAIIWLRED